MQIEPNSEKPIFIQLSESIEDNILKGIFPEETQIPSSTEVAVTLKVNPATANRAVNLLVDTGVIYKKRGVGMFVCTGAREIIINRRRKTFYDTYILTLLDEALKIGLSQEDVITMIQNGRNQHEQN